jgi:lysophospholipase L1-like esterase
MIRSGIVTSIQGGGWPLLPFGARIVYLGDSIFDSNVSVTSSVSFAEAAGGEVIQAQALSPNFNADDWYNGSYYNNRLGSDQGVAGDTPVLARARVPAVLALNPNLVVINIGVNGIKGNGAAAQFTTISGIVSDLRASKPNLPIILGTVRATASAYEVTAPKATIQALNTLIRAYVPTVRGLYLWDAYASYDSGNGWGLTAWYGDGLLHPNSIGAYRGAVSLAAAIQTAVAAGNVFLAGFNSNLMGSLAYFAGSSGTKNTGVTGSVATGVSVSVVAAPNTVVASLEANADTGGQSQVLTVTPGGTDATASVYVAPTGNIGSAAQAGQWVRFAAEIELDAWPYWTYPLPTLSTNLSGGGTFYARGLYQGQTELWPGGAKRFWAFTERYLMPATLTSMGPTIQIYFTPNGATGIGVAKVRRWVVTQTGSPVTEYQ